MYSDYIIDEEAGYHDYHELMMMMITLTQLGNHADVNVLKKGAENYFRNVNEGNKI